MASEGHQNRIKGGDTIFPKNIKQSILQKRRILTREYPGVDFTDEQVLRHGSGFPDSIISS